VPTDALAGPTPTALQRLYDAALAVYDGHRASARRARAAWRAHRTSNLPPRLVAPMNRAIARLPSRAAALQVAQAALDLQLQYRPPATIDRERLALWARQAVLDSTRRAAGAVNGDVTTMEWIRDRIANTVDPVTLVRFDRRLTQLRAQVTDGRLRAAARIARRFFG
jgi:hypothetical protein